MTVKCHTVSQATACGTEDITLTFYANASVAKAFAATMMLLSGAKLFRTRSRCDDLGDPLKNIGERKVS